MNISLNEIEAEAHRASKDKFDSRQDRKANQYGGWTRKEGFTAGALWMQEQVNKNIKNILLGKVQTLDIEDFHTEEDWIKKSEVEEIIDMHYGNKTG